MKLSVVASAVAFAMYALPFRVLAGTTASFIDYQHYRDFAENKGQYQSGAINISVPRKDGSLITVAVPVPDFSSADSIGVGTLIDPSYIASVKHNKGYTSVTYGGEVGGTYKLIDRNEHSSVDFHAPRLNKVVTEVAPSEQRSSEDYFDLNDYTIFARVGSGTQNIIDNNGYETNIEGAYNWLTGGFILPSSHYHGWNGYPEKIELDKILPFFSRGDAIINPEETLGNFFSPLPIGGNAGDSGSPLWGFNKIKKQWELVGVYTARAGSTGMYFVNIQTPFVKEEMAKDILPDIINSGTDDILWRGISGTGSKGTGIIEQGDKSWLYNGLKSDADLLTATGEDLNFTKHLTFAGESAVIRLKDSINMGAGKLTFLNDYIVTGDTGHETWVGAGIDISSDKNVLWQINGVKGDNLHKIGQGTLTINGTGVNEGGLKVGDGTVILSQKTDSDGNKQAFSSVNLSSGRATVVLSDSGQVNPDTVYWGYRGGKLDVNGNSLHFTKLNAADYGAQLVNTSGKIADISLDYQKHVEKDAHYAWHGQMLGKMNFSNKVKADSASALVMDGSVNLHGGVFSKENGRLVFQGHPVIHAVSNQSVADKVESLGDTSVITQPVSFNQHDWETRSFSMGFLQLKNAQFSLSRNAHLNTNIQANNARVILGDTKLFIDKKDGEFEQILEEGVSQALQDIDRSKFLGSVFLENSSSLAINDKFSGDITAYDSQISVSSRDAFLNTYSTLVNTPLTVVKGGLLTATEGLWSDRDIFLQESSMILKGENKQWPSYYTVEKFRLEGDDSKLLLEGYSSVSGHIESNDRAGIVINGVEDKYNGFSEGKYTINYEGTITAPKSSVNIKNASLDLTSSSFMGTLDSVKSQVKFINNEKFDVLNVDGLHSEQADYIFRTDLLSSDKIVIKDKAKGKNNGLFVDFLRVPTDDSKLSLSLITAPAGTSHDLFHAGEKTVGFTRVLPSVHVEDRENTTQWILDGYKTSPDKKSINDARGLAAVEQRYFLAEVNNLNKRMGELRNNQDETGVWARFLKGSGHGENGFSDRYTLFQTGLDKKTEWTGGEMFSGGMLTHSEGSSRNSFYSGEKKSVGAGIYTSFLFDSGAYVDLTGKYIYSKNKISVSPDRKGESNDYSHSLYAGVETGFRWKLNENLFLEPQAEVVSGIISGTEYHWKDSGASVSLKNKRSTPVIGRAGIVAGREFINNNWKFAFRTGIDYQTDLKSSGKTILKDDFDTKTVKQKKDGRMLYHMGVNVEMKDNVRAGLEIERSAFGKYNIDHAINATFRYSF